MNEIQPAFVAHCADVSSRKTFYIQVFEGPPSSQSFKVFDENDQEIETVGLLQLQFSDVSETYQALLSTASFKDSPSPMKLNIIGIQPWLKNSNGSCSQS